MHDRLSRVAFIVDLLFEFVDQLYKSRVHFYYARLHKCNHPICKALQYDLLKWRSSGPARGEATLLQ